MLQEFLRRGQKIMGRQTWFQFQGGFQCWTWNLLTAGLGFSLRWKICQKTAMEVVDLRWIFAVDSFWSQNAKEKSAEKIRRKIRQPKTKNPPAHDPPEIRQPGPKIRRKTYQQIRLSNLQVHARFFSIEKDCSWRRLQSMDSGTLFGCLLGMVEAPMLKCTCNPSAAAGGMDKVCCAPFPDNTFSQKRSFWENGPKIAKQNRHATVLPLAAQISESRRNAR